MFIINNVTFFFEITKQRSTNEFNSKEDIVDIMI